MKEAYQIWKMDQKMLFAKRDGLPLAIKEDLIRGYSKATLLSIEDLSKLVDHSNIVLPSGAEVLFLAPKQTNRKLLISLHGGPESKEGFEIRYLGLYRNLLRRGWSIAILNYRGSSGIAATTDNTWKKWKTSILVDFSELKNWCNVNRKNFKEMNLLGASFGGALALLILQNFKIKRCVLFSPLLDLPNQMKRAAKAYKVWFDRRFSSQDKFDLCYLNLTKSTKTKVLCYCSLKDEVLGIKFANHLFQSPPSNFTVINQFTKHCPRSFSTSLQRYKGAFEWLI